jgi:nicotinamide-nucleotide amidase
MKENQGAGGDPLTPQTQAGRLVRLLTRRGETVATSESLTAGLLAATLAGVPGASAVLRGGLVVYATDSKQTLGGVPAQVLAEQGPVAAQTARWLARGARERFDATWGVALTGVAGPDPQDGHPVGVVFLGIAGRDSARSVELRVQGSRWQIRWQSAQHAINELLTELVGDAD